MDKAHRPGALTRREEWVVQRIIIFVEANPTDSFIVISGGIGTKFLEGGGLKSSFWRSSFKILHHVLVDQVLVISLQHYNLIILNLFFKLSVNCMFAERAS